MLLSRWTKNCVQVFPKIRSGHVLFRFSSNDLNNVTSQNLEVKGQQIDQISSNDDQVSLNKQDYNIQMDRGSKLTIDPVDPEQISTLLDWMNTASANDFQKLKSVSRKLASNVIDLRTSQGSFQSPNDLLKISGVAEKTLSRICENILNPKISEEKQKTSKLAGISQDSVQNVQNIVSISIGLKQIGWVHVNRSLRLTDWNVQDLPEEITPTKWDPFTYFHLVNDILHQLPETDLYLLEHKRYVQLNNNKSVAQVYIFLRAIESLFYGILNTRRGENDELKAVSIPESITCRHFDLMVGNRRKSGQKLVEGFLKENFDLRDDGERAVFISTQLSGVYQSANKYQREVLANALLQCLAFCKNNNLICKQTL
ncbi:transcription elongation factor, mitochondrial-like [Antedon mediterranea]|uniref:transcription elongation factor, mitochondrial-like n=1 Tax=Antedon mediterranea TaxID=105859 RepID=UPI003AF679BD